MSWLLRHPRKSNHKPKDNDEEVNQCVAGVLGINFILLWRTVKGERQFSTFSDICDYLCLNPTQKNGETYPNLITTPQNLTVRPFLQLPKPKRKPDRLQTWDFRGEVFRGVYKGHKVWAFINQSLVLKASTTMTKTMGHHKPTPENCHHLLANVDITWIYQVWCNHPTIQPSAERRGV